MKMEVDKTFYAIFFIMQVYGIISVLAKFHVETNGAINNDEPFICPTDEGFFAIPGTCGSDYYVCIKGVSYVSTCPAGAIFDPVLLECMPPELASCFSCPTSEGTFPIPGYCGSNYYICIGGIPYNATCPGGSIFDPILFQCVPPESASCATETTELLTTFTTELLTTSTTEGTTMTDPTSIRTTPRGPTGIQRTVVFMRFDNQPGQYLFIKGGIGTAKRPECSGATSAVTSPCAIPITVKSLGTVPHYDKYNALRVGDNYLDFFGKESTQGSFGTDQAYGTALAWTTNDAADTQGRYQPLNTYGPGYWMVDFDMDCDKTENGWFELIGTDNQNEEAPLNQDLYCGGSGGGIVGARPYESTYHMGYCGYINVFEFGTRLCEIDNLSNSSY